MQRTTQKKSPWVKIPDIGDPRFNLYRSTKEKSLWQVRLTGLGNYKRRRFRANNQVEALRKALDKAGLLDEEEKNQDMPILDASELTLSSTRRGEYSQKEWRRNMMRFMDWINKAHPDIVNWGQLNRGMMREFLATLNGCSPNTKRLVMQPLTQSSGFLHREFGFTNFAERLGLGTKLKSPPKAVYLEDVVSFCDWLKRESPVLEVGAALQGLAGLQLLEALRLNWDKIDLERGLVEISGDVKNSYRQRVIPVAQRVLDALKRSYEQRFGNGSEVVRGFSGVKIEDHRSYSRMLRKAFKGWNPRIEWCPKDLRNALPTFCRINGVQGQLTIWEQYIGHAPRTVSDTHYFPRLGSRSKGEKNALERQMNIFREQVVNHVDVAIG